MEKNNKNLIKLRMEIEKAIDDGDIESIDILLDKLPIDKNNFIKPENPFKFAEDIKNKNRKDDITMKRKLKFTKTAAIAAAIASIATVSISGAILLNHYSFSKGDKFYTITSNQEIDKSTLDNILEKSEENPLSKAKAEIGEKISFNSIDEAKESFNINIPLPEIMPNLELSNIFGEKMDFGTDSSKTEVWATYGNPEKKAFGITAVKYDFNEDVTSATISDIDEGTLGEYTTAKGYKFSTFKESDETKEKTAYIYSISKDNYKYAFSFFGFSESEMNNILDSLNLE